LASLTIRNIPDEAKRRFRLRAAAHGRSMEEEARQLIVDAASEPASAVQERRADYDLPPPSAGDNDWVHELVDLAAGAGEGVFTEESSRTGLWETLYEATRPGLELPLSPDTPASYAKFDE
jgi:plasmid stability protein